MARNPRSDAYTWDDLVLMWELGRAHGHLEAAERAAELAALPPPHPLARTWEEQVAARLAEMERAAAAISRQRQAEAAGQPRRPWATTKAGEDDNDHN
jgi:hypothetical protein